MKLGERSTNHSDEQSRVLIQNLVFLVFWAILFTLAYAQSPLYTSNQNQYFLQGLARTGFGYLSEDWLANTLDPTPVFSKFIEISWRIIPWQPFFYLYFGLLAGIYLFSILGIVNQLWDFSTNRSKRWLFLTIILIMHSAALRYLIVRALGDTWDYLLDGGVANQRLLGPVLQPSTFGVFLLFSIYLFLRAKRGWAIFCLLVAATFHPTYLLSAGILTSVYMGVTFWETRNIRAALALGAIALVGVSPILWHTYNTFGATTPELAARARQLLVAFRIPHHAVVAEWLDASVLVKLGFIGLTLVILQQYKRQVTITSEATVTSAAKLFHLILWPSLIAILLTLVQVFTDNVTLALLFPWRLSTWLLPLSVSLVAGWGVGWLFERFHLISIRKFRGTPAGHQPAALVWDRARYSRWVMAASLITALTFAAAGMVKFVISWQEKNFSEERPMLTYVEAHKESGEVYLIPIKMQDFRLVTGAPAYVEFKSIPYKDVEVLEWQRRIELARKFYALPRCKQIIELNEVEGITHLVLPASHETRECKQVEPVYQDKFYGVYQIQKP